MAVSGTRERSIGPWILEQHIGSGSFAVVWKAQHSSSGAHAAIKEINTEKLNRKLRESLASEISVLQHMKHKNVVCLLEIIKEPSRIYIVLEFCSGGDLAHYIRQRGRVSEATARYLMQHLAAGLKELRVHNLIHRDLKPQNLLLSDTSGQPLLKIADFGFARNLHPEGMAETLCGSPLYMAPEILHSHKYDAKADLWSVGAILFELLVGKPPFGGANQVQLLRNIERYEAKVPETLVQTLSADCLSLLHQLLKKNPVERISFEEFFCHPFLALWPSPSETANPTSKPAAAMQPTLGTTTSQPQQRLPESSGAYVPSTVPLPMATIHPIAADDEHLGIGSPLVVASRLTPRQQANASSDSSSGSDELMGTAHQPLAGAAAQKAGPGPSHTSLPRHLHIIPPMGTSNDLSQGGNNSTTSLSDSFDTDYVLITNPYNPLPNPALTSSTPAQLLSTPTRLRAALGLSAHPAATLLPHCTAPQASSAQQMLQPSTMPQQCVPPLPLLSTSPLDGLLHLPEAFAQGVRVATQGQAVASHVQDYNQPGGKEVLLKRMLSVVFELAEAKAAQGDAAEALSLHLLSLKLLDIVVRLQPRSTVPATDTFTAAAKQLLNQVQAAVAQLCTLVSGSHPLPDSSSLLYQWAILLGKDGATDELMGNTLNSISLYCKASDVFVFLALDWGDWGITSWQELQPSEVQLLRGFHKALLSRITACEAASSRPKLGL